MTRLQSQVLEFMRAFQQDAAEPGIERIPSHQTFGLGMNLIKEEHKELQHANSARDRKDALGDLLYVTYWMANAHGFDLPSVQESLIHAGAPMVDIIHRLGNSETMADRRILIQLLVASCYAVAQNYGFEMAPITDEIHRSNMSKMWTDLEHTSHWERFHNPDGQPELKVVFTTVPHTVRNDIRRLVVARVSDGKIIKSPSYSEAQL
jgi:predicted HAD superfamily Cof-like phosphohydrolase